MGRECAKDWNREGSRRGRSGRIRGRSKGAGRREGELWTVVLRRVCRSRLVEVSSFLPHWPVSTELRSLVAG